MNMKISKKKILKYILIFLAVAVIITLISKNNTFKELICIIIISLLITYTLKPFQIKMMNMGIDESLSALIVILTIILILLGGFLTAIPYFFKQNIGIKNALGDIQNLVDNIYFSLRPAKNTGILYILTNNLHYKIHNVIIEIFSKICNLAMNFSNILIYAIIIPIIVYYFLADSKYIMHILLNVFPVNRRLIASKISCHIDKILGRYIVSQLILSFIVGIATLIILIVLKVDFPFVLAFINAFFNIIPYFGPIFGAIPAIFVAFINSPKTALEVAIVLYILQQIEGNILCPKITGDSISMHPLTVIFLLLIGDKAAGILGMVIAVPLGAVIKIIYRDLSYYIF
ncbi:putative PurR-regulated permease PerM [Clostridium algifaecis]|uniref:PurR-regulated permease PerM n=1 Tax=Clostridium algifaecis TaxID=1472040 RepID=A0ABS4KNE7_9CLOT|nr:AI-2E family transporter [Clostridium algifaecis]MBP2031561.1 putative PurR-regulated permease PerM [Clostridium algifaecis]